MPLCPIRIPDCLLRELEFAERHCINIQTDRLFPIRYLWLMEAHEQGLFGLSPLERSCYHPEKLLGIWDKASVDLQYRIVCEADGLEFDFDAQAVKLSMGWIYIGERFIDDFLDVEAALGVEMYFPDEGNSEGCPVYEKYKHDKATVTQESGKAQGMLWIPSALNRRFSDFLVASKMPHARFHDLRHMNATLMLKYGISAKVASSRLGHSSIGVTLDIYSHVLNDMQDNVVDLFENNIMKAI